MEIFKYNKAKVNMVLTEIIDKGHVQIYNNSEGRYVLTEETKR